MNEDQILNCESINDLWAECQRLGMSFDKRIGKDKLKALMIAFTKQEATMLEDVKERMYKLNIHKTEGDNEAEDVPVSVNGKTWLIKRGYDVTVPNCVVEVLRNAVKEMYSMKGDKEIERREVPAYPFTAIPV